MRPPSPILSLLLIAPAAAQGFNVDVGQNLIFWPTPGSSYGAASGQTGHWSAFDPLGLGGTLEDLSGASSTVTLTTNVSSSFNLFPSVLPSGDDQALLEDFQFGGGLGEVVTFRFEGLDPGGYTVYTYAADPSSGSDITQVSVVDSADPAQNVQGPWAGMHGLGTSYARHNIDAPAGVITIELLGINAFPNDRTACNGIQIVPDAPLGITYCSPAENNTTGVPGRMFATGGASVASNNLTLRVQDLPQNEFGIFINSLSPGFVANPNNSQGNLCVIGAIGRYNAADELQNSGSTGAFELTLDLTQTPTPLGTVSILAGETWYFQCWYRDFLAGQGPTSNFTDAIEIPFQ